MKIGCIGQGFVGKNIADNLEERGYEVVRYALEEEYKNNAPLIANCNIVFIAVPTPSTPDGFDYTIISTVLALVADGAIAVIKSTVLPGTTGILQNLYPQKIVLFSPEFLCETTAAYDVANPILNIIGVTQQHRPAAEKVLETFPKAEHNFIVSVQSAELFKYAHNLNGYFRVILSNLLFEVGDNVGAQWEEMKNMMDADVMMSPYYNSPVHKGGRGAGGNCFVKDMAAFRQLYSEIVNDKTGLSVLQALEKKNLELLIQSRKSKEIIEGVYGKDISTK